MHMAERSAPNKFCPHSCRLFCLVSQLTSWIAGVDEDQASDMLALGTGILHRLLERLNAESPVLRLIKVVGNQCAP